VVIASSGRAPAWSGLMFAQVSPAATLPCVSALRGPGRCGGSLITHDLAWPLVSVLSNSERAVRIQKSGAGFYCGRPIVKSQGGWVSAVASSSR
jgi:hypothetical protein